MTYEKELEKRNAERLETLCAAPCKAVMRITSLLISVRAWGKKVKDEFVFRR